MRKRGVVTLPASLRKKYNIKKGDSFQLVDLDGVFVMTPMTPMVPELAREIEQMRKEAGLTTDELLEGLRRQRKRHHEDEQTDGG